LYYFLGAKLRDLDIGCIQNTQQNRKKQIMQNQVTTNLSKKLRKDEEA